MTPLIEVRRLTKKFSANSRVLTALDDISFSIRQGEALGIVGESGCGKSTLGKCLLHLYQPTSGEIHFDGNNLGSLSSQKLKALRRKMQMIFQDPYSSLNPRMRVREIISEGLQIHHLNQPGKIEELMAQVGLNPSFLTRYPREFSGGQRQRIGIARALAVDPMFLVCDEPTSALDVCTQATILKLLKDLKTNMGLTYLFISHNLNAVEYIADRIAVMYLGKIVETASTQVLIKQPLHPYTKALFSAIPIPDPKIEKSRAKLTLVGEVPSPFQLPTGCPFHTRCPNVLPICKKETPQLKEVSANRLVACHLYP